MTIDPATTGRLRQLFIDLDGVLADFDAFYEQTFGAKLDRNAKDPPGMWDNIERHGRFYADLPVMSDALALWEGAKRIHPHPIILTGLPHSITDCEQHKREWVTRFIDADATVVCCASKDKRLYGKPGDVLIDDWHRYRPMWEEMGGIFILHRSAAESLAQANGLFPAALPVVERAHPPLDLAVIDERLKEVAAMHANSGGSKTDLGCYWEGYSEGLKYAKNLAEIDASSAVERAHPQEAAFRELVEAEIDEVLYSPTSLRVRHEVVEAIVRAALSVPPSSQPEQK